MQAADITQALKATELCNNFTKAQGRIICSYDTKNARLRSASISESLGAVQRETALGDKDFDALCGVMC